MPSAPEADVATSYMYQSYSSAGDKIAGDSTSSTYYEGWEGDIRDFQRKLFGAQAFADAPVAQVDLTPWTHQDQGTGLKPSIRFDDGDGNKYYIKDIIDSIRSALAVADSVDAYNWPSWVPTFADPETGTRRISVDLLKQFRKALGVYWESYEGTELGGLKITRWIQERRNDGSDSYNEIQETGTATSITCFAIESWSSYRFIKNAIIEFDFTDASDLLDLSGDWEVITNLLGSNFNSPGFGFNETTYTRTVSALWDDDYTVHIGSYSDDPRTQTVQERYETDGSSFWNTYFARGVSTSVTPRHFNLADYWNSKKIRLKVWCNDDLPPYTGGGAATEFGLPTIGQYYNPLGLSQGSSHYPPILLMAKNASASWSYDT